MKKTLIAGAVVALAAFNANAVSVVDLAFTAFNADEDGWSMVALANISANTEVFFTDNEWEGSSFNTGESFHRWTSGASQINAGTVIRFSNIDKAASVSLPSLPLASSVGTLARETVPSSSNYGMNQGSDTVYAYLGTATTPTTFLAAISNGVYGTGSGTTLVGALDGTGLTIGAGAIQLTASSDYAEYNGARSGLANFVAYKTLVRDVANWTVQGDGTFAATVPDTTAFTITPVPEPETYALLLAGLGLVGTIVRRRRAD